MNMGEYTGWQEAKRAAAPSAGPSSCNTQRAELRNARDGLRNGIGINKRRVHLVYGNNNNIGIGTHMGDRDWGLSE